MGKCQQGRKKFLQLCLLLNRGLAWLTGAWPQELPWIQRRHGWQPAHRTHNGHRPRGTEHPCCARALAFKLVSSSFFFNFYF